MLISHFFSSSSSSNSFKSFLAVRSGDVVKFDVVRSKYVDQFKSDRTFTLILRLHHNVIKTAIRRISLAYSRISLADVAAKLKLESPKDAEYIIAKVNLFFEQVTMCDFHNFGLILVGQMHCLPQRLKSTLFEIFSNGGYPRAEGYLECRKNFKQH